MLVELISIKSSSNNIYYINKYEIRQLFINIAHRKLNIKFNNVVDSTEIELHSSVNIDELIAKLGA